MYHAGLYAVGYPGEYQLIDEEGYPVAWAERHSSSKWVGKMRNSDDLYEVVTRKRTLRLVMEAVAGRIKDGQSAGTEAS